MPAEDLFPHQPDVMVGQINDGPHNIRYCPGRYTLQVANFTGRSTFDPKNDPRFTGLLDSKSPLATAAEDAEKLAEALSKDKEIQKTGFQPYVYHDRYSSRVTIGSFNSPNDPAAQKLHDQLIDDRRRPQQPEGQRQHDRPGHRPARPGPDPAPARTGPDDHDAKQ